MDQTVTPTQTDFFARVKPLQCFAVLSETQWPGGNYYCASQPIILASVLVSAVFSVMLLYFYTNKYRESHPEWFLRFFKETEALVLVSLVVFCFCVSTYRLFYVQK